MDLASKGQCCGETPEGERAAFAVSKVSASISDGPLIVHEARGAKARITGEAVVLKVAPGKYLFALLKGAQSAGNADNLANIFRGNFGNEPTAQFWSRIEHNKLSKQLSAKNYPLLVTFSDINDPSSVKKVNPNNLAASFGAGYSLKSITLEITDEAVTKGVVEGVLGWLEPLNGGYLHGGFTSKGAPLGLAGQDFKKEGS